MSGIVLGMGIMFKKYFFVKEKWQKIPKSCKFAFRFYFGVYIDPRCFLGFFVNISLAALG